MRRAIAGSLAVSVTAALSFAALADTVELMPKPLEGWTASGPVYGESLIENGSRQSPNAQPSTATARRIEISRDYSRDGGGLRISLNTHDRRGAMLIAYVNDAQKGDPEKAAQLAARGIFPFGFKSWQGVTMRAGKSGEVSGAALKLGAAGTLTLEGIEDGKPGTVALDHVKAYLDRIDLKRMNVFVLEANSASTQEAR